MARIKDLEFSLHVFLGSKGNVKYEHDCSCSRF